MLLSTDWFLPYWTQIGMEIAKDKKIGIQQGCREIVEHITAGDESTFIRSFSENHKQEAESQFLALLRPGVSYSSGSCKKVGGACLGSVCFSRHLPRLPNGVGCSGPKVVGEPQDACQSTLEGFAGSQITGILGRSL